MASRHPEGQRKANRLNLIVNLLWQRPIGLTSEDLARELHVTQRTIQRDLEDLQDDSYRVPLERQGVRWTLLTDKHPLLSALHLTFAEATALLLAARLLQRAPSRPPSAASSPAPFAPAASSSAAPSSARAIQPPSSSKARPPWSASPWRSTSLSRPRPSPPATISSRWCSPPRPPCFAALRALTIAQQLGAGRANYSLHATLAEAEGCEFWTGDQRFYHAAHPAYRWVQLVTETAGTCERVPGSAGAAKSHGIIFGAPGACLSPLQQLYSRAPATRSGG